MGCQSSDAQVQDNFSQTVRKRICIHGLDTKIRQKLLSAIQKDDLSQFVILLDENKIKLSAQLSQFGLFWMSTHFCCRWDSERILQYILKTVYLQNPQQYINFVNSQTIQGYTAMHLCIIWDAKQCIQVLLKYGGLYLHLKNNTQAYPYQQAIRYKRTDFITLLKDYQDHNIVFLNIQHDEILNGEIITFEQINQQYQDKRNKPKKLINIKFNINLLNNQMKGWFQQTQQQLKILQEKKKFQEEKEKLRQQIKKMQEQQAKKQAQKQKQVQEEHIKRKQKQVEQKQRKLLEQLANKQRQIQKAKTDLIKIQQQKYQRTIQEQKKKIQQIKLAKQAQIKSKIQQKNTVIQQKKQQIQKAKQNVAEIVKVEPSDNLRKTSSSINGRCPPQLQQLYLQAQKQGIFTDKQFPQSNSSIGQADKAKKFLNDLAWLRPCNIFKSDYMLFDGIQPSDIKQGSLGVCYMLATLSSLAANPDKIKNIFVFHDKQIGFYVLRLLIHGELKNIVVDDALPCSKNTKAPLFAKPNGNQLWVCLVEKAWAKCIGNYMKAESMTPNFLMEDLTTCPTFGGWFKDDIEKTKNIDLHIKQNNIVVLTSVPDKKIQGIVNSHAYSLLAVYQHQGKNIYKIRNPWGKFQWNGTYGDNSTAWTDQLKRKVSFTNSDDGVFYMAESQILTAFVYYSICMIKSVSKYFSVKFNTKKNENKFYTFDLDEDMQINLRVCQQFNRMLNDANYKYSPVIFEVGRIQQNKTITFLTQGDNSCFWGAKSVHADNQLTKKYTKGKYFVRIAVQWENQAKYNTGVFSIYGPKQIKINQIKKEQGQKYWVQLLKDFVLKKQKPTKKDNMQYIMVWMRGQMVCYSFGAQTQTSEKFQAKWTFTPSKFVNCTFGLNHVGGNDVKYTMGKGVKNANVGTLSRGLINQGCSSGNVFISAEPI